MAKPKITLQRNSALALLVVLAGCQTAGTNFSRVINEPAPLSAEVRASFGTVGVLPDYVLADPRLEFPQNKGQAMGTIAAATFNYLDKTVEPASDKLRDEGAKIMFDAIVASVAGVFGGLLAGIPEPELKKGEAALRAAIQQEPIERGLQAKVYEMAGEARRMNLIPVPAAYAALLKSENPTNRNYRMLAGTGVDSVLLVRMAKHRFEAAEGINPAMVFAVEANMYVIRVADGELIACSSLDYRSRSRTFTHWARRDAKRLRSELRHARDVFTELLLDYYFGERARR